MARYRCGGCAKTGVFVKMLRRDEDGGGQWQKKQTGGKWDVEVGVSSAQDCARIVCVLDGTQSQFQW
jgi:hypothetical protein